MVLITGKPCPKCGENSLFPYTLIDKKTEKTREVWSCSECHFEMDRNEPSDTSTIEIRNKKAVRSVDEWIWIGRQMHLCVDCDFHLATYVGNFVVSTVGEYYLADSNEMEPIGAGDNSFYETMVFGAKESPSGNACGYYLTDLDAVDMRRYTTATEAREGHIALCRKWSKRESKKK